ncbi:hypothetical protein BAUCODRAFT_58658, partial [Baudoinia panamericana UAMH 10762]
SLPDNPTALVVTDGAGQSKWTVTIPHNASFPLRAEQYADICRQGEDARSKLIKGSRFGRLAEAHWKPSYYSRDWTFLDVADAEQSGALPIVSEGLAENVCSRSLTFVMDTEDAGFGKTLLLLWLSYGLAKKEGRAFFVDDTNWPYGNYSSYFAPPPVQRCPPPPRHEILPCPHQTRHLVVSAATAPWTFGALFERAFMRHDRDGADQHKDIYALLHKGYKALFELRGDDALYARDRAAQLRKAALQNHGAVVSMHIRRGDLHPHEYQYTRDYLPLERYAVGAQSLFRFLLYPDSVSGDSLDFSANPRYQHSPLLLASDDPDIVSSTELSQAIAPWSLLRAQERIQLASKSALDQVAPVQPIRQQGSAYVKHVDENSGWEGGFYPDLFYSIGKPRKKLRNGELALADGSGPVTDQAMRMREFIGRAYLLDLAVLSKSDGVVCAVSSATCRLLGVMMGWEAVRDGKWVNVDDGRGW